MTISRSQMRRLFFSCVIYSSEEIELLKSLPVLLRYVRIAYVWSLGWINPEIRDWLNLR